MQKPLLVVLCALLLPCAAMAQSFPEQMGYVTSPPENRTAKDFVQAMMMNDKFAIVTGDLAQERSRNQAVRDFATHAIAVHRKIWTDMKRITDRSFVNRRVTPPPVFDPPHGKKHRALLVTYGSTFDRLYLSQQFEDQQEQLATLEGYANGKGGYPPLQEFARRTAPAIHDLQARLGRIPVPPSNSGAVASR